MAKAKSSSVASATPPTKAITLIEFMTWINENSKSPMIQTTLIYLRNLKKLLETHSLGDFESNKEKVILLVMNNVCSDKADVRNITNEIFIIIMPFLEEDKVSLQNALGSTLCEMSKHMVELCKTGNHIHVFKVWSTLIKTLDKTLHKNRSLINTLLVVLEKTFKISISSVQAASYNTWKHLIDNFALDKEVLVNVKRMKLLMQPLASSKNYSEEPNLARFDAWWHLAFRLEDKLLTEFSTVCLPLLNKALIMPNSGSRTLLNSSSGSRNLSNCCEPASYASVQLKGCEVLIRILEMPVTSTSGLMSPKKIPNFSIPSLKDPISNSLFLTHSNELLKHAKEALVIYKSNSLPVYLHYLLHLILQRMTSLYKENPKGGLESISNFLHFYQSVLKDNFLDAGNSLKLIDEISRSLPTNLLSSHSLHSPSDSPGSVHVVPAFALLEMLVKRDLFSQVYSSSLFLPVFTRYVAAGAEDKISFLKFLDSVFRLLEEIFSVEEKIPLEQIDVISKMWLSTSGILFKRIEETHDINMGDTLEHNFSTLLSAIVIPSKLLLRQPSFEIVDQSKEHKMFENICRALFRFSGLIESVEKNCCCEELSQKVLQLVESTEANLASLNFWMWQVLSLHILIDCIDFQALNLGTVVLQASPTKWVKKNSNPLGNLFSFTCLLDKTVASCLLLDGRVEGSKRAYTRKLATHQEACVDLVPLFLNQINNSEVIINVVSHLSPTLVQFTTIYSGKSNSFQFSQKVEELWKVIVTTIQVRYFGVRGQVLFDVLCPLLEATLQHPSSSIKERSRQLWQSVFACNHAELAISESFRKVLRKAIPPLVPATVISSDDMPNLFDFTDKPDVIPGSITSPAKFSSLFTNKPPDMDKTTPSKSPLKLATFQPLEELKPSEFVKIDSSKRGRPKVLTEHQKEVMKRKSFVPAMYNDLSQNTCTQSDTNDFSLDSNAIVPPEPIIIDDSPPRDSENVEFSLIKEKVPKSDFELSKQDSQDSMDIRQREMSNLVENIIIDLDDSAPNTPEAMVNPAEDSKEKDNSSVQVSAGDKLQGKSETQDSIPESNNQIDKEEKLDAIQGSFETTVSNSGDYPNKISIQPKQVSSLRELCSADDFKKVVGPCSSKMPRGKRTGPYKNKRNTETGMLRKNPAVVAMENVKCPLIIGRQKNLKVVLPKLNEAVLSGLPSLNMKLIDFSKDIEAAVPSTTEKLLPTSSPSTCDLLAQIATPSSESITISETQPFQVQENATSSENLVIEAKKCSDIPSTIDISSDSGSSQTSKPMVKKRGKRKRRMSSTSSEIPLKRDKLEQSAQEIIFPSVSFGETDNSPDLSVIDPVLDAEPENCKENQNPELQEAPKNSDSIDFKASECDEVEMQNNVENPKPLENEVLLEALIDVSTTPSNSSPHQEAVDSQDISENALPSVATGEFSKSEKKVKTNLPKSLGSPPQRTTRLQKRSSMLNLRSKLINSPVSEKKSSRGKKCMSPIKLKISRKISSQTMLESWGAEKITSPEPIEEASDKLTSPETPEEATDKVKDLIISQSEVNETSEIEIDLEPTVKDFALSEDIDFGTPVIAEEKLVEDIEVIDETNENSPSTQSPPSYIDSSVNSDEAGKALNIPYEGTNVVQLEEKIKELGEASTQSQPSSNVAGIDHDDKTDEVKMKDNIILLKEANNRSSEDEFYTTAFGPFEEGDPSLVKSSSNESSGEELYTSVMEPMENEVFTEESKTNSNGGTQSPPPPSSVLKKQKQIVMGASPLSRSQRMLQAAMNRASGSPSSESSKARLSPKSSPKSKQSTSMESPSTGILKQKRKKPMSETKASNNKSPSPNSKQRRVSFADPLTVQCVVEIKKKVSSGRRLALSSSSLDNNSKIPSETTDETIEADLKFTGELGICEEESQLLNSQEPIFKQLIGCTESLDLILPSLTSSFWLQSLRVALKANSINSIGELSKLTPLDVNILPLVPPKVSKLVAVLSEHSQTCTHLKTLDESQVPDKLPDESQVRDILPDESQVTDKLPDESQVTDKLPDESQVTDKLPDESQVTNKLPDESQVPNELQDESQVLDQKQEEPKVANEPALISNEDPLVQKYLTLASDNLPIEKISQSEPVDEQQLTEFEKVSSNTDVNSLFTLHEEETPINSLGVSQNSEGQVIKDLDENLKLLSHEDFENVVINRMRQMSMFETTKFLSGVSVAAHKILNKID